MLPPPQAAMLPNRTVIAIAVLRRCLVNIALSFSRLDERAQARREWMSPAVTALGQRNRATLACQLAVVHRSSHSHASACMDYAITACVFCTGSDLPGSSPVANRTSPAVCL